MILMRYVEQLTDEKALQSIGKEFFQKTDIVNYETQEKGLSLNRFKTFVLENNWLKDAKINSFLDQTVDCDGIVVKDYADLQKNYRQIIEILKKRFYVIKRNNRYYQRAIKQLEKSIRLSQADEYNDPMSKYASFLILHLESRRMLLEIQVNECLTDQLLEMYNRFTHIVSEDFDDYGMLLGQQEELNKEEL